MLDLVAPRFISLDTSHWAGLCRSLGDMASKPPATRRLNRLSAEGCIPAISFHQLQELLAHEDERTAIARLSALRHVSFMATIGEMGLDDAPGSIIDIQRQEIIAAINYPTDDAQSVLRRVRASVFRTTTGDAVVEAIRPTLHEIRERTLARQARTREISSISQATTLDQYDIPFDLNGAARSLTDIATRFADLNQELAKELAERGDRRMADPVVVAREFVESMTAHTKDIAESSWPAIEILKIAGLTADDVKSFKKVGQVCDLAQFRRNIEISSKGTGISPAELQSLSQDRLPTWIIHRALRRHRAIATEAQGGDLTDGYLLSLAPYFHTTFVDKRTLENVRRIRQHETAAAELLGDVRKASTWSKAFDSLLTG